MSVVDVAAPPTDTTREVKVIDCDVHPTLLTRQPDDPLIAGLSRRSREYYEQLGLRGPVWPDFYPKIRNGGARADSVPPDGGIPGSDGAFLCEQLLDGHGVDFGILVPLDYQEHYDDETFTVELVTALNDAQIERFCAIDDRLRGSILVPHEQPAAAVAEIERRAGDGRWAQVTLPAFPRDGAGDSRYWPIYEAATAHGLPVGYHAGGYIARQAWSSYYMEDHIAYYTAFGPTFLTGLVASGVFEAIPAFRVVMLEQGVTWLASAMWTMDAIWERMPLSAPRLERLPSEYVHDHVWVTTQPLEEPDNPDELGQLIEHARLEDRLMFSTDYPHWDFDSPTQTLPRGLSAEARRAILAGNASALYGFPTHVPGGGS